MKFDEKYYDYLDGLRESGVTNMLGATPYLEQQFPELTAKEVKDILVDWMKTFGERRKEK